MLETLTITIVVSALAFTWFLTRRHFTSRIARLSDQIGDIAQAEHFRERIELGGGDDELGRLERTVNTVFDVIDNKDRAGEVRARLFRDLAESAQEAIFVHRESILYANPRAAALRGARQEDLVGMAIEEVVHPLHRERVRRLLAERLAGDAPDAARFEIRLDTRTGDGVWVEATLKSITYGDTPALLLSAYDISARRHSVDTLLREKNRAHTTLQSIGDGVITTDASGTVDYVNAAAATLLGRPGDDACGKPFAELVSLVDETDRKPLRDPVGVCLAHGRRVSSGRRALMLAGDKECGIEMAVSPLRGHDGTIDGTVVVLRDVSDVRGLARQMSYQASHDALTGLYNRREFERRLGDALEGARSGGAAHVVCYMDLDRFKAVNDTCGHMAGDNMLREVAGLIREQVRDSDSVARLGGDEFGVLLHGCPLEKARQIADDVCRAVEDYRFVWRDKIFQIGVSVGLVETGRESGSVIDALAAADSACYIAKHGRSRVHVYSVRDEAVARHRGEIEWLQRLQNALKDDLFDLHVQPIVSLGGPVTHGPACEVLVRMRGDDGRQIAPREFMRAAERYQLMPGIDRWVIKTAFAAIGQGAMRLPDGRSATINLSGQTLGDARFLEFVVETLDATGVNPERICFEVNEASVITNFSHAQRFIEVLHGMGCRFALDDFGSGLGSLSNLRALSMDYIKIDGSFIRDLSTDEVSRAMVAAMIKLARTLDIRVVAEQVADQAALEAVREMGMDFAQGFAIGRPRPLQPS